MQEMSLSHIQVNIHNAMETLQLTPETVSLLTLFPVIYVAWAARGIDPKKLQTILRMARETRLSEGEYGKILGHWLEKEPDREFWESGLYLMRVLLGSRSSREIGTILELTEEVSQATEGLFGIPYPHATETQQVLKEICVALGIRDDAARKHLLEAAHVSFSGSETQWKQPIQWPWVQMASIIIVLLLSGAIYLQHSYGLGVLVPKFTGKAMTLGLLFEGPNLWLYILVPLLPFLLGGAALGWKSEGEIYIEATIAALIPLIMYWLIWLIFATQSSQDVWSWSRMVLLLTFTILAGATAAAGAFFGDRLNSQRNVGI